MKRFLLDTNVISELVRPSPNKNVVNWLSKQAEDTLYLSVITLAEIMRGVSKLENGNKKIRLHDWIKKDIAERFSGRILDFDQKSAFLWGEWQGQGDRLGTPYSVMDAQVAAIVARFEIDLVTRNTKDFSNLPINCFNPWLDEVIQSGIKS